MFTMIKYQILMSSRSGSDSTNTTYTIFKMASSGTTSSDSETFTDALLSFITQGSGLKTAALTTLVIKREILLSFPTLSTSLNNYLIFLFIPPPLFISTSPKL